MSRPPSNLTQNHRAERQTSEPSFNITPSYMMPQFQSDLETQASIIYRDSQFEESSNSPQIRLLALRPASCASDPLIGDLTISYIYSENVQYAALSYVWGDETVREPMVLNGVQTSITSNLAKALRRLRSKNKAHNLWADAVCINQSDAKEKGVQVALMGHIYYKAERTYIWLGEEEDSSDLAMDLVTGITAAKVAECDWQDAQWMALYRLLRRTWWTRLWIIQEAVLSQRPIVRCGSKEVGLDRFAELWSLWNSYQWKEEHYTQFHSFGLFHNIPFRKILSPDIKTYIGAELISWMVRSVEFQCRYMRDRIYGILSLAGPFAKQCIEISYEKNADGSEFIKSDRAVMLEAGVAIFNEVGTLGPMHMAGEQHPGTLPLPSWCPDFTGSATLMEIGRTEKGAFPMEYFAEHNSVTGPWRMLGPLDSASIPRTGFHDADWRTLSQEADNEYAIPFWSKACVFSRDFEVMAARGVIVDTVDFVGTTEWIEPGDTAEEIQQFNDYREVVTLHAVREWKAHVEANKATAYPARGWKDAFWRTVIANRGFDYEKYNPPVADESLGEQFDAWISGAENAEDKESLRQFERAAIGKCAKRAFVTTVKGYFGLVPTIPGQEQTQPGDLVCLLRGALSPCVLRPVPDTDFCIFLGSAYVHGIMDGEYLSQVMVEELLEFWIK